MKKFLMYFLLSVVLLISGLEAKAANRYSVAGGNWTSKSTWSATSGGTPGADVPVAGDDVYIEGGYLISGSGDPLTTYALNSLSIASGSTYQTHGAFVTTATTITVYGTLINSGTADINGSITVNSGGIYQHYLDGGTIPTATWNTGSTCLVTGNTTTAASGLGQSFYNLTWNCVQTKAVTLPSTLSVANTFTISNSGNYALRLANSVSTVKDFSLSGSSAILWLSYAFGNTGTLTVTGNFTMSAGTLNMTDATNKIGTLNVAGNFTQSGGTLSASGAAGGVINFNGSGTQTCTSISTTSNLINFNVISGTLQMGTGASPSVISGSTGSFTLSSGATLGITSAAGITSSGATGNIQVTGTRTFNTGANYIYNGSGAQATGNGLPTTAITGNITIANGASVTSTNAIIENGTLAVNGILIPGAATQIMSGTGSLTGTGTVQVNRTAATADFSSQYTMNKTLTGLTVEYSVPGGAQIVSPLTYGNLKLDNTSGTNTLGGAVTVNGTLTTTGGGTLTVGASQLLTAATVTNAGILTIDPSGQATVTSMANSGTLNLNSTSSSAIFSLMMNSYSGSGTTNAQLYLTGGGSPNYKWHYISIPITTLPVTTFTGITQDIVGYAEQRVSIDLLQGWVAWDGYVYSGGGIDNNYTFTDLLPGKGYDYWDNATPGTKFTFSGQLNSSALSPITLTYGGYPTLSGWNLLGNPFPSGIDWDVVTASGYPSNTGKAVYFTKDNVQYTYAAGTGIPENATSHIPPMQGFFIRTYGTGNTFTVPTSAKEHNTTARYKGVKSVIPLVRLKIAEDTLHDETVVRFDENAKPGLDYDFDALKAFNSSDNAGIYTSSGGIKYAINGQPFPETSAEYPVIVNLTKEDINTLTASQLQGLDDYNIYLTDKLTGYTANLKTTPVLTFSSVSGLITDRFILKVSNATTGVEENPASSGTVFNIYPGFGLINIQTLAEDWDGKQGSVTVLDLSGRTVTDLRNIEFSKNSVAQVTAPSAKGLYIVELRSGVKRYVGKVIIK